MANSKYAYVRNFELPDPLLPGTFMLYRLDGHSFHRFSDQHGFKKPNDVRALELMDHAAKDVMTEYADIVLAFGESDEFSFLLRKSTTLYNRRESKIVSTLTSLFTASYVFNWPKYFPDTPLQYLPSFDGRIVLYPEEKHVRDYFAWRQADAHINNLYNTTFWALIEQGGQTTTEAHATLRGTFSKEKNEILFTRFGINYNTLDARFRKGSVLFREEVIPHTEDEIPGADGLIPIPRPIVDDPDIATDIAHGHEHEAAHAVAGLGGTASEALPTEEAEGAGEGEREIRNPESTITNVKAEEKIEQKPTLDQKETKKQKQKQKQKQTRIEIAHCDIIKDEFWDARVGILRE